MNNALSATQVCSFLMAHVRLDVLVILLEMTLLKTVMQIKYSSLLFSTHTLFALKLDQI
jgi:hypothetical protein